MTVARGNHPASGVFPLMDDAGLAALVEDVRAHGLLEPIVLHDGLVLDGRNRLRACELAGVEPRFVEWRPDGMTPVEWVVSMNLHRRHLTTAQRAALALDLLPHLEEEARERSGVRTDLRPETDTGSDFGRADAKAAELVGVGRTTVANAKAIQKRDETGEIVDRMRAGEINVAQAAREVGFERLGQGSGGGSAALLPTRRDTAGKEQPTVFYGKGDKWRESTLPLVRYLAAWEKRGFEFRHINYREARRRLATVDQLIAQLTAARPDLEQRSRRPTINPLGR